MKNFVHLFGRKISEAAIEKAMAEAIVSDIEDFKEKLAEEITTMFYDLTKNHEYKEIKMVITNNKGTYAYTQGVCFVYQGQETIAAKEFVNNCVRV